LKTSYSNRALFQAGESIGDSDKYKVHDGLLVIESLSEHDSGAYKCVASNAVGNASQIAELKVLLKPRIEKLHDFTKKENEDVEIVCKYGGDGITGAKFVFGSEEYAVVDEEHGKELAPADRSQDENGEEDEDEEEEAPAKDGSDNAEEEDG
ncbi:hypothetical protein ANCCAN_27828, partial [Ancylostoma caninum]